MPEVLLINPRRHTYPKARRQRNPWDSGAISRILHSSAGRFFGEKGGSMARHHHRKSARRNPGGYHHHRHRRNPRVGGRILPMIGGAAIGGFLTRSLPQTFLGASNAGIMGYAANAAVAVGGSWLVGKWSKDAGLGFLVGGGAAIALRVYQDYTSGASAAGASDGTMSFYATQQFPVPYATSFGNPYNNPFAAAYPGAALSPVMPTGAGIVGAKDFANTPQSPMSKRLRGRFSPN
jgi:hypothetical protein